jgi:cytochrome c oxidase subunit III
MSIAPAATESGRQPRRAVHRASPLTVGTIVFLASEVMFFSGLFATYFTLREISTGAWPPPDVHLPVVRASIFTALLISSSVTMQLAVRGIARGDKVAFRRWVIVTVLLGLAFLGNQAVEWTEAEFSWASHAFGSLFFTMTGFHGAHVTGGVLAMGVLLARSGAKRFGKKDLPSVEVVSYYWHFVDVVWVIMFAILFFAQ